MRAATITEGAIVVDDRPDPRPGAGELLVRVHAAGLNGADILQMKGSYPPPPGVPEDIPGLEFAGEVAELGLGASRFVVGDRVMGIVGGAAQAELIVVHERIAMPVPDELTWVQAGGTPEAYITAHDAIFTQAELTMGERLLVHGAAGGVGLAACELGLLAGARVTATVRSEEARERLTAYGVQALAPDAFEDAGPYDVVLELVGAVNLPGNIRALAPRGRIAIIGVGAGADAQFSLHALMQKRGRITASTLRARSLEDKAVATRLVEKNVLPALALGARPLPVSAEYALEDAAAAYERFQAGKKFGKIVLVVA